MCRFIRNIIVIGWLFIALSRENGISDIQFELIKPDSIPVFYVYNDSIITNKGTIGCALFCLRITSVNCTGFALFPGNKSCVALSGSIDGELGLHVPEYFVYRRKHASSSLPDDTTSATTTAIEAVTTSEITTAMLEATTADITTAMLEATTAAEITTAVIQTTIAEVATTADDDATTEIPTHTPPSTSPPPNYDVACAGHNLITTGVSQTYCAVGAFINYDGVMAKSTCENTYSGTLPLATSLTKIVDYKAILNMFQNIHRNNEYMMYMGIRQRTNGGPWLYDYDDQQLSVSSALWEPGFPTSHTTRKCVLAAKSSLLFNDVCSNQIFTVCEIVL